MMLEGKRPEGCNYCWNVEDMGCDYISDRKQRTLSIHEGDKSRLPTIINNPWDMDVNPEYIELSFGNQCNFKCGYCHPRYSSRFLDEIRQYGPYGKNYTGTYDVDWFIDKLYESEEVNPYIEAWWMWWIKASIQEYILRSWSLVKIGTTTAQKKLFFNLKKIKNQISPETEGDLRDEHVDHIANKLDVSKEEVVSMNRRLSGKEFSLNAQVGEDGDEWQDWLVDKELDHDLKFAHHEEMEQRKDLLKDSIKVLNDREREILYSRRLNDDPTTLEDLSKKYKISRERVRQIENKAFEKLQKHMLLLAKSKNLLPAN